MFLPLFPPLTIYKSKDILPKGNNGIKYSLIEKIGVVIDFLFSTRMKVFMILVIYLAVLMLKYFLRLWLLLKIEKIENNYNIASPKSTSIETGAI